ncbi:MAG TPA: TetR/AcrR family transcriptional regulator [Azospirillum sp.]|nr:TetR/AcrR family transcriptional regulator [Azospirillum sp.]
MPLDTTPEWRLRRRDAILAAAAQLFARRPYHEVQVDDVAKLAGVGKATLYRYFPSKEELYLHSFDEALGRLEARLHVPPPAHAAPEEVLACKVRALLTTFVEQLPTLKVLGGDHSHLAEQGRQVFRRRSGRIAAALREVLENGMRTGRFRGVDTELTPLLIIGMSRGAIMMAGSAAPDRLEAAILDLVLNGTLAEAAGTDAGSSRS